MGKRRRHILALVFSEQGFELAEVRAQRNGLAVVRTSTLAIDQPLASPIQVGEALGRHVAEQGYGTRHVVVGLPTGRLLARHKLMPQPSNEQLLQDMLRLAIERDFTGGGRDLCADYWKQTTAEGKANVLLIATTRDVIDRVQQLVSAAGLHVVSITSTLAALATDCELPTDRSLLVLNSEGAELLLRTADGPSGMTHVSAPMSDTGEWRAEPLAEAVMRTIASSGLSADKASATPRFGVVCDPALSESAKGVVAALSDWAEVSGPQSVAPAVALAKASLVDDGKAMAVDFTHRKLDVDPRAGQARRRRVVVMAMAIAVLLLGLGASVWHSASAQVAALEAEYAAIHDEAQRLQQVRDRMLVAEPWFSPQPVHLGCLWDLTQLFPEDQRIWVNHLRLRTDAAGAIQCRAESRSTMIALLEAMERSPAFDEVQLRDWQEVGRDDGNIRFEITFQHVSDGRRIQETGG